MQCNTSFVVLDPKGEIIRSVGHLLEENGYVIKVIDLIDMSKSLGYNPFHYIQSDKDVLKLITNLIRNTTPKGSSTNDPFWEKSETALLEALMLYLYHYAPEDEQNFTMVMEMLNYAEVKEDEEDYESPLDELFKRLEMIDSNSLALKQYDPDNGKNYIFEIPRGAYFRIYNGRVFKRGNRRVKRYECLEVSTGRIYLFNPNAEVEIVRSADV